LSLLLGSWGFGAGFRVGGGCTLATFSILAILLGGFHDQDSVSLPVSEELDVIAFPQLQFPNDNVG
jgi:hypothetical protein